ncbi:MAG: molybdenum cofactor guanylyltransferase [Chloroflexi bacterium]|nr:molybdenum cofactor guanylyltransferase [Chloroflexota bacterium]
MMAQSAHDERSSVSAVILAGGKSRRMGRDKSFIEFEGRPLIARVIERVSALSDDVIVVTNDAPAYEPFGTRLVADVYPGKGSLGGVYSGLLAARHDRVFAVACDMPFLNLDLMRYMIALASEFDVVIPRAKDPSGKAKRSTRPHPFLAKEIDLHPTHAVYAKSCLASIQARLLADDLRIIGILESVSVRVVEEIEIDLFDPKHLSFFNMNTPHDLDVASQLT